MIPEQEHIYLPLVNAYFQKITENLLVSGQEQAIDWLSDCLRLYFKPILSMLVGFWRNSGSGKIFLLP